MANYPRCPNVKGSLEISKRRGSILIAGDPDGLRSLAKLLNWLADVDQNAHPTMPDGEREHTHLYADSLYANLTPFSATTELCRLDAKGTGEFPEKYRDVQSRLAPRKRGR